VSEAALVHWGLLRHKQTSSVLGWNSVLRGEFFFVTECNSGSLVCIGITDILIGLKHLRTTVPVFIFFKYKLDSEWSPVTCVPRYKVSVSKLISRSGVPPASPLSRGPQRISNRMQGKKARIIIYLLTYLLHGAESLRS